MADTTDFTVTSGASTMNISGNGAGNPIDPKRPDEPIRQQRVRAERPVTADNQSKTVTSAAAVSSNQTADSVDLTAGARFIEELTEAAGSMEDTPRQYLVDRISGQITNGSYNSASIARQIAQSLLDKGLLSG